jgi:DNA-binding PadR family transcriptional regulator
MFRNRRPFAFQFEGGDYGWEEQGLPWMRHGERGPHLFGMRMRRGPFGPGGPGGPGGPFGPEGPFSTGGGRFFGRGDVKFALLDLLQERPMHGYEMMKALEERSGGFYAPSAGSIYPTLQMLEDRELVTVQEVEGKKVYKITDTGRAFLAERQKNAEFGHGPHRRGFGPGGKWNEPDVQALRTEAMEVARLFALAGRTSFRDPQKLNQLRSILERTRKELSELIDGENPIQDQKPTEKP